MKTSTQASRLRAFKRYLRTDPARLRRVFYALKEIEIVLEKAEFARAAPSPVATVGDLVMPGWYTDFVRSAMFRAKCRGGGRSVAQQQAARATATAITELRRRHALFDRLHVATVELPPTSKGKK